MPSIKITPGELAVAVMGMERATELAWANMEDGNRQYLRMCVETGREPDFRELRSRTSEDEKYFCLVWYWGSRALPRLREQQTVVPHKLVDAWAFRRGDGRFIETPRDEPAV